METQKAQQLSLVGDGEADTKIIVGDCRSVLRTLPDESIQCCVTSPPYFGLRDYGTADWDGGDPECNHQIPATTLGGGTNKSHQGSFTANYKGVCGKCGAVRIDRQIGLETNIDEYVEQLVSVFREVRRVLRPDGTLWLNLGDSYSGSGPSGASYQSNTTKRRESMTKDGNFRLSKRLAERGLDYSRKKPVPVAGLKSKDLIGIPWRVAFALQADGWWLRSDIIWHKPNPMPESIRDRPTKAHEYLFLFAKSARYYYDADAIKEPSMDLGKTAIRFGGSKYGDSDDPKHATKSGNAYTDNGKRNKRSVWTITPKPFRGAHFATFPPDLVEPCVLAGSRQGDIVIDPFGGSGTTGLVANRLGRNAIIIELNPEYAEIARGRVPNANVISLN